MITEQHVYLALETYQEVELNTKLSNLALDSILLYAAESLSSKANQSEITDNDIARFAQEMILNHTINAMINDGIIDQYFTEDGTMLELTDKGKEIASNLNG